MKNALIALAVLAAGSVAWLARGDGAESRTYRLVTIERGDVESIVSSTGNVAAVMTVAVGTQVSGIVSELLVDFNDDVAEGQVMAVLDTTLLAISVREAETGVARSDAELVHAQRTTDRVRGLYERGSVAESELIDAEYALDVATAAAASARISLERARRNLGYATITAPISGTVIERNVDVGQTVAASLSAPQLFLIANDLSRMNILASVDESDIGLIEKGQRVRFGVQAFPEESFTGVVRQVRLQSAVTENVVSYSVVVDVDNPGGRLLPGMTATVDFLVDSATDVLTVPNAALRFRPTDEMRAALEARTGAVSLDSGDRSANARLYVLDQNGAVQVERVRTGLTDGTSTVVEGRDLDVGLSVIAGFTTVAASGSNASPFQAQQSSSGRRGPRGATF